MKPILLRMRAFGPFVRETIVDFRTLVDRSFFLITGPTGSGKTTIFDAMTFALFGETSGSERSAEQMRSQHADPGVSTEVSLDFSIGTDHYRIWRAPKQDRPNRRGPGAVTELPRASLWSRTGLADDAAPGTILAERVAEVNRLVIERLGFSAEQFRQVVLLPQGKFQKFLASGSAEREKILEALFGTEVYRRIEEALKEAAAKLAREAEKIRGEEEAVLRNAPAPTKDGLLQRKVEIENACAALAQRAHETNARVEVLGMEIRLAREIALKIAERDASLAELGVLEKELSAHAGRRTALGLARKALPLLQMEAQILQRQGEAASAKTAELAADQALAAARVSRAKADQLLAGEEGRAGLRRQAEQKVRVLEEMAGKARELVTLRQIESRRAQEAGRRKLEHEETFREVKTSRESVDLKRSDLAQAEAAAQQIPTLRSHLGETLRRVDSRKKLEEVRKTLPALRQSSRTLLETANGVNLEMSSARVALETLERAWMEGQAGRLALELEPGMPCVVCGSSDHPNPTRSYSPIPREADLLGARDALRSLEEHRDRGAAAARKNTEELAQAESRTKALEESLGEDGDGAVVDILRRETEVRTRLAQLETAAAVVPARALELQQAEESLRHAETKLESAERGWSVARLDAERAAALAQDREGTVPEEYRDSKIDAALESAKQERDRYTAALEAARQGSSNAAAGEARAEATFLGAKEASARADNRTSQATAEFEAQMKLSGIASKAAYAAARKSEEEVRDLETTTGEFEANLHAARERTRRAIEASQGLEPRPVALLEEELQKLTAAKEEALRQEAQLWAELKLIEQLLADLERMAVRRTAVEQEYAVLGRIAEVANGRNPYNMTLQRFVLQSLLGEVLAVASRRLSVMSRRRYALQVVRGQATGRGAGGLDLEVQDAWTCMARPVATLSGGEGFQASLALALGLADVVQSRSGGIRLDTVFVDEGFGTLDEEVLDLAIDTLIGLRENGRLVGIISHVRELKERIDTRLEIELTREGSAARFVMT